MKEWILNLSLNKPRLVYLLMLTLVLLLGAQIPAIQTDTDPENMLAADNPQRLFHNQVKQRFALHDAIVLGAVNNSHVNGIYNPQSLAAMHQLTREILAIDGVVQQDLMALSVVDNITQEAAGAIRFQWMMKQPPTEDSDALHLRTQVQRLPLLHNTLVSGDGKAAAIYIPITRKDQSYRIAQQIEAITTTLNSDDQYHITGLPVAEDRFGYEMFVQMGISAPLAGLMIFVLMWLFFRNVTLITAPMIVAMATVISTMGLLIGLGHSVHIMSSMIAIFLMPIAVVDSVHIMSEFADRYRPGTDAKTVIREVVSHLFTPMLYTSVTSTVGFLSLTLTPIPPVQIFGAFVGFGIMLAFILTIVFIPAYISRMSPTTLAALQAAQQQDASAGRLGKSLLRLGNVSVRRSKLLITSFIALFGLSVIGITQIQINDNPIRWFKSDHDIRIADRALNAHFAGTYNAYLVLSHTDNRAIHKTLETNLDTLLSQAQEQGVDLAGEWPAASDATDNSNADNNSFGQWLDQQISRIDDRLFDADPQQAPYLEQLLSLLENAQSDSKVFQQPAQLRYLQQLQQALQDSGYVGKSNALPDLIKTVNRELHSGQAQDYQLPTTQNGIAQALLQYQSSHRPQDLWHMVTPDYRSSVIWLQLKSGDNQDMSRVIALVDDYIAANPLPRGIEAQWAGKAYINVIWQDAMVAGMVDSLIGAFMMVFIMMVVLFRSLLFGLLAMLPLTITITFIYGLIGWLGKDYDMPIAVLSALTLGLSVDFAIHFLERARALHRQTGSFQQTMAALFEEPARAISRNAIVIAAGFTPLLFAPLVPYITVGVFLALIMATSALVTLVLLPAIMSPLQRVLFAKEKKPSAANPAVNDAA